MGAHGGRRAPKLGRKSIPWFRKSISTDPSFGRRNSKTRRDKHGIAFRYFESVEQTCLNARETQFGAPCEIFAIFSESQFPSIFLGGSWGEARSQVARKKYHGAGKVSCTAR